MADEVEKALSCMKSMPVTAKLKMPAADSAAGKACMNCCIDDDSNIPSSSNSSSKSKGAKAKGKTSGANTSGSSIDANVVAAAEAVVNGELDAASCYHVSMKMSIDAATPRICGDTMPLKCDALAAMREALSASKPLPVNSKLSSNSKNSSPPCQLLERLNFPEGNIINTLHTILALPPFDAYAPAPKSEIEYKNVVSLMQWSLREDNVIEMELSDKLLHECKSKSKDPSDETRSYLMAIENMRLFSEDPKNPLRDADGQLRAITNLALIFVKHHKDEFFTFCSCKECLEYRETIMAIMMDQFKAAHMVVMLLDVLIKAYSPMLKNDAAYNKFEKLLESNKQIYWITSGFLYDKNAEYLDFIDDTAISDNMILVLFSAILMANNPMLLLQILAYNVECIVKAFSEGMIEIAQNMQDNEKTSAEKMLTYLLDGYSDLNCISQKISLSLFAFENDFLRRFKLSWVLLCQRLFQQHVFNPLGDTMLACILSLKEGEGSTQTTALIKRYMLFDEHMHSIERRWTDIWMELNKFNLSATEHDRRLGLLDVYNIFDKVVMDATSFSLPDISDDEFIDFQRIVDRQLAWKNIMAFTKLKWPDGFYDPPNKLVHEDFCKKCKALLEHHNEHCKCITCSIAGTPLLPIIGGYCPKCTTLGIVDKDGKLMKSKILSTCTSDEAKPNAAASTSSSSNPVAAQQHRSSEQSVEPAAKVDGPSSVALRRSEMDTALRTTYHIAWAVFQHLTTRKRYRYDSIEPQFFCGENCRVSACQLARKILANELSPPLTKHLLRCFQPLSFSREELRSTLPSLMFFNRKLAPSPAELQELKNQHYVYKTYWTFVLSIYANFFVKFNSTATDFKQLELIKGDLRLRPNSIIGDKDDGRFEQFLAQIIGYSPFKVTDDFTLGDANIEKMQFGVDHLMMFHDSQMIKRSKPDSTTNLASKSKVNETTQTGVGGNDSNISKKCKEKMRKCCADYADIGEPCKENHSKKRVKKECNHARFNETRDRLRKKLTQIANDRKSKSQEASKTPSPQADATAVKKVEPVTTQQPPSLKVVASAQVQRATRKMPAAAAAAAAALNEIGENIEDGDNSLLCLDSLCKSIQMHTDGTATGGNAVAGDGNIPVDLSNYSKEEIMQDFAEFLGSYTREQDQKRWINETLNFIEGKPQQPQTLNPKKAAKKAKQKQRKEEEKRIKELEDLRSQFLGIYFKEFNDKNEMKALTAAGGRKREKKRIAELEANIKNLQRAKAKVETVILELIATVKQANSDFKFSYLPTKEQQQAKLAQMEEMLNGNQMESIPVPAPQPLATPAAEPTQYQNFISSAAYFPPHVGAQHMPVCYAPPQQQQQQQQQQLPRDVIAAMATNAITADPSKRIVTIRRVQLPHSGGEQQVTVVAKGSSPDEDKLLYTFVNGHMVASAQVPAKSSAPAKSSPPAASVAQATASVPEKSAKARKKEAKRAAAAAATSAAAEAAAASVAAANAAEAEAKISNAKNKKQNKKAATIATAASSSSSSGNSSKTQTPQSSAVTTRENSVCSVKPKTTTNKKSKNSNKNVAEQPKALPPVPQSEPEPEPAPVKKVKRLKPRLDQGQLDNNPFKSLHVQDSSDGEWETGSETEASVEPKVIAPPPPPIKTLPKVVSTSKQQTAPMPNSKQKLPVPAAAAAPIKKPKSEMLSKSQTQQQQQQQQSSKSMPLSSNNQRRATSQQQQQPQPQPPVQTRNQAQRSLDSHSNASSRKSKSSQTSGQGQQGQAQAQLQSQNPITQAIGGKPRVGQQHSRGGRGSGRSKQPSIGGHQQQQSHVNNTSSLNSFVETNAPPPKRTQRGKRGNRGQKQEDLSGIPHNMGYFNPNEVAIPPQMPVYAGSYASTLTQQMQHLRIGNGSSSLGKQQPPNCSIMDQLNRGVQVEHLSLPPGITLTKVDPAKSEQLRQKSESIRKLSKPLSEQQHQHTVHQPPAHLMGNYYAGNAGLDTSGGVIMVEANPRGNRNCQPMATAPITNTNVAAAAAAATAAGKSSRRRRRNRGKSGGSASGQSVAGLGNKPRVGSDHQSAQLSNAPIMEASTSGNIITLRNPMFHQGINNGPVASSSMLTNPNPIPPARAYGAGMPIAASIPMDQPAAIIKNENGMFTIRNPALHQAVTNGLAMGGYRQFGSNVNYYTPQEAVAEAARATQQKQPSPPLVVSGPPSGNSNNSNAAPANFSYFSSGSASGGSNSSSGGGGVGVDTHNNISISCTNVPLDSPGRLIGDAAVIARPKHSQKCLSAIGSELKQKTKDGHLSSSSQWLNFGQPPSEFVGGGASGSTLQEKYQQSSYYNGFEVFPTSSVGQASGHGGSPDCHMHHNCGDDSPPPTITGFNSYLDGIPNTGVIRYDDAAFLKNLIPGQHLNNEVSIHNISESNFTRNNTSPSPHHVEITTVFGNRTCSTNAYEQQQQPTPVSGASYCDNVNADYGSDSTHLFVQGGIMPRLPQPSPAASDPFGYDFEPATGSKAASVASDLNEFLRRSPHSHRTSPYSTDENAALETFVQNMSALQIANAAAGDEQCSRLNGSAAAGGTDPPVADVTAAGGVGATWW